MVVIHNGIIENYLELRHELMDKGRTFSSETDTEVIAHLIDQYLQEGRSFAEATRAALRHLSGSFALVALSERDPGTLLTAKNATPIVIGLGEEESFVASDIPALLDYTRRVLFLDDGEMAEVSRRGVSISDFSGRPIERQPRHITWDPITAQKSGYKHFLLKEIHEQPQAIIDTMRSRILEESGEIALGELTDRLPVLDTVKRATLVACGTAWHACLVGKFLLEELAGLPVSEMSRDQVELVEEVLADLLLPFRRPDAEEAMRYIKKEGKLDGLSLSFYRSGDVGNDGIWDNWQLQGRNMVWYFRGSPHVHVWVNIRA